MKKMRKNFLRKLPGCPLSLPAVTCKYEAQKANKEKQSASHGGKCPEAVTGQRQTGLTPAGFKKK